jgi:rod shape-determining protein MreC
MAKRVEKFPQVVYRKHTQTLSPHPSPWVRKPGRHLPEFAFFVILSFVAMAVDVQYGFGWLNGLAGKLAAPMVYSVDRILFPLARSVAFVRETWDAKKENAALREELDRARRDLHYYESEFHKNLRYRELLNLKAEVAPEAVAAQVLRYQDSAAQRAIVLRAGEAEGLEVGQPVLGESGQLLGRISRIDRRFSTVVLLTDPSCRAGVAVESTQAQGILYNRNGQLFVSVDRAEEVREGDRLVTSHLSDLFPEGLLVGRIVGPAGDKETDPLVAAHLGLMKSYRVEPVFPNEKWGSAREVLCLPAYRSRPVAPDKGS